MAEQRTVREEEAGQRFDRWVRRHFPDLPYGAVMKLVRTGQFRLDGRRVTPDTRIAAGQMVRIPPQLALERAGRRPERHLSEADRRFVRGLVRHADDDILILEKPAGLAVQGGPKTRRHLDGLLAALAEGGERPRLVHRLDRDTAGVLVLARHLVAARALMEAFRHQRVEKIYWAVVLGRPPRAEGVIDIPLGKAGPRGEARMTPDAPEVRRAVTGYRVLARAADRAAWLELRPHTGRTHQLRAHCALLGCPVMGDAKYGDPTTWPAGAPRGLMLQAMAIAFPHPRTGRIFRFALPRPAPHLEAALRFWGLR